MTARQCPHVGHDHRFKRDDAGTIAWGRYVGAAGVVDSAVFQRTADYPDEFAPGYRVVLDTGPLITVRWDQVGQGAQVCDPAEGRCPIGANRLFAGEVDVPHANKYCGAPPRKAGWH